MVDLILGVCYAAFLLINKLIVVYFESSGFSVDEFKEVAALFSDDFEEILAGFCLLGVGDDERVQPFLVVL